MNPRRAGCLLANVRFMAALALAIPLVLDWGSALAAVQYLGSGAIPNSSGGWHPLPPQGTCPADLSKTTRPDCLALRLNIVQASCVAPNLSWNTSGVCNDLVNATQGACEAAPDRLWNSGTGVCAIVMKDDDRNNVTCALHGGNWVTTGACIGVWVMPARTAYTPNLLTGNGPGDQCLRCHNAETQYNGPRVRDVENFLYTGHANMARKVQVGLPWGGPPFSCSSVVFTDEQTCEENGAAWNPTIYPSDDAGNVFDWINGRINASGGPYDLAWIYGDWLSPLPRAIYRAPASSSQVCSDPRYTAATCVANGGILVNNAGASYSCARCHTTGWTSDATINTASNIDGKEPELSFPGITWDRNSNAGFGVVNLSGGVVNDPNQYASWDQYGIVCTRCHSSAIDTTTGTGSPAQYSAPAGMSSHHSSLTTFDVSSGGGVCTDSRFTAQAQCDAAGAAWLTACSVAGVCSAPAYTTSGTCLANGGTWTKYDTSATCTAAGGTFYTSSCSLAGVCNTLNPAHSTQTLCEAAGGQWAAASDVVRCLGIHQYGKENDVPAYEAATWTGSKPNRGPIITRLCMDCHRQETGGMPYANASATAGTLDTVNPGQYLKVGPAHGTVSFVSHPHGNMFLNSPHGKFTGTFNQVATGKFAYDMSGDYKSFFQTEGEAANTGNGCTGCHDVHESVVPKTSPFPAIHEECTECHAKNLDVIMHPRGTGTPLENMATDAVQACELCHMPGGQHLFRVKADAAYSTFPSGALTGTVNANTSPDGTFTNAVWVDMDHSCGQCHGGGTAQATTTGSVPGGSKVLTVASTTGFAAGERITVADAGSLTYDDEGAVVNGDLETYIVSVVPPSTVNLAGAATAAVSGKSIVQNPTKNGAGYMTRAELAGLARGIHNDKPYVSFGYSLGSPNTLTVNVNATASACSGSSANCDAYDWDWSDGSAHGSGVTASHTFASGGAKAIVLTVHEYGVNENSLTRTVTVYAPDGPPVIGSTCTWNPNTWTMSLADTSTDTDGTGVKQVTVNWGDGGLLASDTTAPFGPFSHVYLNAGTYAVTHKAIDTLGQQSIETACTSTPAAPAYFAISGTVLAFGGVTPVSSAIVTVSKGGVFVKSVFTAANGSFSAGYLKPGTYALTVSKPGYTFPVPAVAAVTVGPSSAGNDVTATAPFAWPISSPGRILLQ